MVSTIIIIIILVFLIFLVGTIIGYAKNQYDRENEIKEEKDKQLNESDEEKI